MGVGKQVDTFVDVVTVFKILSAIRDTPGGSLSHEYVGCCSYATLYSVSKVLEKAGFVRTEKSRANRIMGPFYNAYYITDIGEQLFQLLKVLLDYAGVKVQ